MATRCGSDSGPQLKSAILVGVPSQEPESHEALVQWSVEYWEDQNGRSLFAVWYEKLRDYDQAVVDTVITRVVMRLGISVCDTEWGKPLGDGLYEVRIRRSLNAILNWGTPVNVDEDSITVEGGDKTVLLRLFCTFHGDKVVLLFQGYDKGKDPSDKKQRREIDKARKMLKSWKQNP